MSSTVSHQGSCHCGQVAFTIDTELSEPMACNCSMCGRSGTWYIFVPDALFAASGEAQLTDYQFGPKHVHHLFCSTCGIKPFGWAFDPKTGDKVWAVNVRCIDGVDHHQQEVYNFGGKDL